MIAPQFHRKDWFPLPEISSSLRVRVIAPRLIPPIDYAHVFWRNGLNLAASLPLALCAEAPAADDIMEALDLAQPFPIYRSGAWRRMIEAPGGGMKRPLMAALVARRKIAQWRRAPENFTLFAGLRDSLEFIRRLPRGFPFGVILHDNEIEDAMAEQGRARRAAGSLAGARLLLGFHPAIAEAGRALGLDAARCHALPHFIDLAFFKPHVQIEGVMKQFRLAGKAAVAAWTPAGRMEALAPLIRAWMQRSESLQSRATLLAGFESAADAEGFTPWALSILGAEKLPPWLRTAGEVPPNHLPYYFNVAAVAVHIPAAAERREFAGWDIAAAAACGCPCVAPETGLHTQYITPQTGALAALDSAEDILKFIDNHSVWFEPASSRPDTPHRMACRAMAEERHSPERFKAALAAALATI